MVHIPRWQIILVLAVLVFGVVGAAPNLLQRETAEGLPANCNVGDPPQQRLKGMAFALGHGRLILGPSSKDPLKSGGRA